MVVLRQKDFGLDYRNSCLMQQCLICGNSQFVLESSGQIEEIWGLFPLCEKHHCLFHRNLIEQGFSMDSWAECLLSLGRDRSAIQRRLFSYRCSVLKFRLDQLGLTCRIGAYQIGRKKSNRHDGKVIEVVDGNRTVGRIFADVKTDEVKLRYNGDAISFCELIRDLEYFLARITDGFSVECNHGLLRLGNAVG